MASGLKTLHQIDTAIAKARAAVDEAGALARRASESMSDVKRREAAQYALIAKDRLALLEDDKGGELGGVDRQAERLLDRANDLYIEKSAAVKTAQKAVEKRETARHTAEELVHVAVDNYDKAAAKAELKILETPAYQVQVETVTQIEDQVLRATDKQSVAERDEQDKGTAFRADPFFTYLAGRGFGTKKAKGWPLTKLLDGWVARRVNYRKTAETYRRLTAIPERLSRHVEFLEAKLVEEKATLVGLESAILEREGVSALHTASLDAQNALEAVDAKLHAAEESLHDALRQQEAVLSGEAGPLKDAIDLLSKTLARMDRNTLQRLTAQTVSTVDDAALEELFSLSRIAESLSDDHAETQRLAKKYRKSLNDLQGLRKKFKSRRYDAPSSDFSNGDLIASLLGQVIVGALASDDLWKQLGRFQKTIKRYSDTDFGGVDWTEGLRLPKASGDWDDIFGSGSRRNTGGFGGGSRRKSASRSSFPRAPRIRLPRSSGGGRKSGGGFRTGGGF